MTKRALSALFLKAILVFSFKMKDNTKIIQNLVSFHRENDSCRTFLHTMISKKNNFLWVSNAKAGFTVISAALCKLEEYSNISALENWIYETPTLKDFSNQEIASFLTSPDWFRFAFVRDPYERLFSAYKSKIMNLKAETHYATLQTELRELCDYPPPRNNDEQVVICFKDFVQAVINNWKSQDSHWCRQVDRLRPSLIKYDFIGKLENFEQDISFVMDRLNAPEEV